MRRRRRTGKSNKKKSQKPEVLGLNFSGKKQKVNTGLLKEVILWIFQTIFVIAFAGILVFAFGSRIPVIGHSMSPTLENGDTVLVNTVSYRIMSPKANDIIVFLPNGNEKSHYFLKRVIAVPGDTVQIKDGIVYVNQQPFPEMIKEVSIENALLAEEPIVVGEDEYFVLGDNRNHSEDSRYANIGNVKKEHIKGKAWFVIAPFDKLGFLK